MDNNGASTQTVCAVEDWQVAYSGSVLASEGCNYTSPCEHGYRTLANICTQVVSKHCYHQRPHLAQYYICMALVQWFEWKNVPCKLCRFNTWPLIRDTFCRDLGGCILVGWSILLGLQRLALFPVLIPCFMLVVYPPALVAMCDAYYLASQNLRL